ncbi:MAG: ORF6N domain-containing protein [Solobacterium sp.]|nr:ORF6N domain-containing protein [Solobacterium sp.]
MRIFAVKEKNAIMNANTLKDKIYVIRGQQVMLDRDLATIYGYEVKTLNQQVKRNIERFPSDFMFQLTNKELENLKSHFVTSSWGGVRKLPYAFTEQGIYQLATVLKGELAVRQSIALMRVFKAMRKHIIESSQFISTQEFYSLVIKQEALEGEVRKMQEDMISKTDLFDIMKGFQDENNSIQILIYDGQPFKADEAYQTIYKRAKRNVIVIDNYIGVKTLRHLVFTKKGVERTVISDNKGSRPLRLSEYIDFTIEYPDVPIVFKTASNKIHDRYIVLDYGTKNMKVYLCGSSSKDSGKKITTIIQIHDISEYKQMIQTLLLNSELVLT